MTLKDFNLLCDNGCKSKLAGQKTGFIFTQEYLPPNFLVLRKPFFPTSLCLSTPLTSPFTFNYFLSPCHVLDCVLGTVHTKMAKNSLAKETILFTGTYALMEGSINMLGML